MGRTSGRTDRRRVGPGVRSRRTAACGLAMNASTGIVRHELFGCHVDALTMDQAVARCDDCIATGAFCQHMALNTAKLVAVQHNDSLRSAVNESALVTADGQGVVWAARLLGHPLPER